MWLRVEAAVAPRWRLLCYGTACPCRINATRQHSISPPPHATAIRQAHLHACLLVIKVLQQPAADKHPAAPKAHSQAAQRDAPVKQHGAESALLMGAWATLLALLRTCQHRRGRWVARRRQRPGRLPPRPCWCAWPSVRCVLPLPLLELVPAVLLRVLPPLRAATA